MSKNLLLLLAGVALIGAGCAPANDTRAKFGAEVTLKTGVTVEFQDGLKATLTRVNDSRCPKDVQCIWAGELAPVISFSGGSLSKATDVMLGTTTRKTGSAGTYDVNLVAATETTATITVKK